MRTKPEIMGEVAPIANNSNDYLFLEVLIDIRDQLASLNNQIESLRKGHSSISTIRAV